jgi:hypothetical protein
MTVWLEIKIMCPGGAACPTEDCCFVRYHYNNRVKRVGVISSTKRISSSSHRDIFFSFIKNEKLVPVFFNSSTPFLVFMLQMRL